MDKQTIIANLRRDLHDVVETRSYITRSALANARIELRQFQMARLAITHADLLAAKETRPASQFFLEDLYGINDFAKRDADIERVIPMMERALPLVALKYIAEAIELDALSESLDCAMAEKLGEGFGADDYVETYRVVRTREERERQIAHIDSVGHSLCEIVHMPLVGASIAAMSIPARLTGLSELHHFLERGFDAFKRLSKPEQFVETIVERETTILNNLYSGKANPFKF
ncbi:hypothetical protein AAKU67_001696 [Oxalobacteraceae bacterium GrIS 2.11]